MAGEDKKTVQDVLDAVKEVRKIAEEKGIDSPEFKALSERVDDVFKKDEEAHQKAIKEKAESDKKTLDLEAKVKDLEIEIVKGAASSDVNHKEMPEYKALQQWFKGGVLSLDAEQGTLLKEAKTMRMDDSTAGGATTTVEMDTELLKEITEISPVRQVSRVKTISKMVLMVPTRTGIPEAFYEGEAEQGQQSQSQYGSEQLVAHRLQTSVPITQDLLMDSQFDMQSQINQDVGEAMAFKEGNKFVLGTGVKQPEGFLVNPDIVAGASTSSTIGTIDPDDMVLLTGKLKVGYNPLYGFNRTTLAFLRTLKDGDGRYVWQANLTLSAPNEINGQPYALFQDMPDIAAGNLSVIYGDFMRGYLVTDRTGMMIIRDDVTLAEKAIVKFVFHRWNHGQVVLSEAFVALKIKAS